MIEEALTAYLTSNVTGCQFEWLDAGQDVTPPFAVIRGEGEDLIRTQQGTADLQSVDIAIDIYAVTPKTTITIERQIKALMQDYRGPMPAGDGDEIYIDSVDYRGRFGGREGSTKLVYQTINFDIWYR